MARIAWNELEAGNRIGGASPLRELFSPQRRNARRRPFAHLQHAIGIMTLWHERARQRSALAQLDDRLLRDLGITRCDAEMEGNKPFWR